MQTSCKLLNHASEQLGANAVAIQFPIGAENDFKGIIDFVDKVAYMYKDDLGKDIEKIEIPAELQGSSCRTSS